MKRALQLSLVGITLILFTSHQSMGSTPEISGELRTWHKVTLTFTGPNMGESQRPNPFLCYRLNVTFSNGKTAYTVPGYYAADGDAANTSADEGNRWLVHFAPDTSGTWYYSVSFRKGEQVAVSDAPNAGESAGYMDGSTGTLEIRPTDKSGRDFRGRGRLKYVGERYLRFAETGEYLLKCGADAPENFLAYSEFDGVFKSDGRKDHLVKDWAPHVRDWHPGDPTWGDGKGKGIIGAVNYLHSEGMNAFSFLTLNISGDDRNVYPYTQYEERYRFDVSKLAQWEIVFEHADSLGMFLHFKTSETENQTLLDGGALGLQRKLYYRELIARFSHHLALNWNLGEENGRWGNHQAYQTTDQRRAMADYFATHDPYGHHIVVHNGQPFDDLLGRESDLTGVSVQTSHSDFHTVHESALEWIRKPRQSGKPWAVAVDEPGDARHALLPVSDNPEHNDARKNGLWGALTAGAWGVEWYFGYRNDHSDLTCQDFRSRDNFWDQCRYALDFFMDNAIPYWRMESVDDLLSGGEGYCFAEPGKMYIVYMQTGETIRLNTRNENGSFTVKIYNPRTGEFDRESIREDTGESIALSPPKGSPGDDWVFLLARIQE